MISSANTFTSLQPMIKEVYAKGKKKKKKKHTFNKLRDYLKGDKKNEQT